MIIVHVHKSNLTELKRLSAHFHERTLIKIDAGKGQGVQIALKVASPVEMFGRVVLTWTE